MTLMGNGPNTDLTFAWRGLLLGQSQVRNSGCKGMKAADKKMARVKYSAKYCQILHRYCDIFYVTMQFLN